MAIASREPNSNPQQLRFGALVPVVDDVVVEVEVVLLVAVDVLVLLAEVADDVVSVDVLVLEVEDVLDDVVVDVEEVWLDELV